MKRTPSSARRMARSGLIAVEPTYSRTRPARGGTRTMMPVARGPNPDPVLRGRLQRLLAELLRPPLLVAAVEVVLHLRDVVREIALAPTELLLALGRRCLARLELLLADV